MSNKTWLIVGNHPVLTKLAKRLVESDHYVWLFAPKGAAIYNDDRDIVRWCKGDPADDVCIIDLVSKLVQNNVVLTDIVLGHVPLQLAGFNTSLMQMSQTICGIAFAPALLVNKLIEFGVVPVAVNSVSISTCAISNDYISRSVSNQQAREFFNYATQQLGDILLYAPTADQRLSCVRYLDSEHILQEICKWHRIPEIV